MKILLIVPPYNKLEEDDLLKKVSHDIASNKVVEWFQGKSEWGPRALGNRSVLGRP